MLKLKLHEKFLLIAQNYSLRSLGNTYPNPSVACIIVDYKNNKNGKILSYGVTGNSGRPHAEEVALKKIIKVNKTTTAYITLEPCFHSSSNQSCVDQIILSGIKNVFIASPDPDKRTYLKSIKKLKKNNINVNIGLTKDITIKNNRFFYINKNLERSYIKYKLAVSKDFKIAKSNYQSKWISNSSSRKFSQNLRFKSDAILTTYSTIKYDNPRLTLRLKGYSKYKNSIIILDSKLQINTSSKIIKSANKRKVIIFTMSKNNNKIEKLKKLKCDIYTIKNNHEHFNLPKIFKLTYNLGICSILVEAGSRLFTNMYDKNIIDEFHLFISPKIIGNKGISMYLSNKKFSLCKIKDLLVTKKIIKGDSYYYYNF